MVVPVSLRRRLIEGYLLVLVIGMVLAAALAWLAVERQYVDTQGENLLAQARLIAGGLAGAPLPAAAQPYAQSSNAAPGIHTRVVAAEGAVIVDLALLAAAAPVAMPPAEQGAAIAPAELVRRPEVAQALQGQPATAVRRVPGAVRRRVLYAAAPIVAQDGRVTGIAYLATPLPASGLPPDLLLQLAGAAAASLLLAGLAGTLLARRIARPLERLAAASRAVSAGDLAQHLSAAHGIAELDRVGEAFNAMTESLRRADQAKAAFVADVTHELRTPLTVIKGTIETLEDGALDDLEGRGPLLASMQAETERLIRLVNDLLLLTRADAGSLRLKLEPLDLGELARRRCAVLAPLAARRGVTLQAEPQTGGSLSVMGDPDRLAQVLDNLLDNAIRHAPEGSAVSVAVSRGGEGLACAVRDAGPGIAGQHLPLIFERFYRVDAARDRQRGGAGLGLAIAKALVVAHGGRIAAASREGEGTTITFTLPVVR